MADQDPDAAVAGPTKASSELSATTSDHHVLPPLRLVPPAQTAATGTAQEPPPLDTNARHVLSSLEGLLLPGLLSVAIPCNIVAIAGAAMLTDTQVPTTLSLGWWRMSVPSAGLTAIVVSLGVALLALWYLLQTICRLRGVLPPKGPRVASLILQVLRQPKPKARARRARARSKRPRR